MESGAAAAVAFGFLYIAYALAGWSCRSCSWFRRWAGIVALLAWIPTALFHLLTSYGLFSRGPALVAIALLSGLATWLTGGDIVRCLQRDRCFVRRVGRRCLRSRYRWVIVAFVIVMLPQVLRAFVLPPLGWDALTYHSVKAAMWVQTGHAQRLNGPGPWAYYRNMPGGAEVFSAWAMVATRSDLLTGITDIVQWLAVGFAVMALSRCIGVREPFASTVAGFVMAIPSVRRMLGSGYSELCLLSTFLTGLTLGLSANRKRPALVALGLGALGVAAATKSSMIGVTAIPLVLFLSRSVLNWRRFGAWTAVGVVAYGIALVPWLVAAAIDSGAPLSPLPLEVGSFVLGRAPSELIWYLDRPRNRFTLYQEYAVLRGVFSPPWQFFESLGLLAAIPFLALPVGVRRLAQRQPYAAAVLLTTLFGCLAIFWSPKFAVIRHYWDSNSSRFLLPAMAIACVLSVAWCDQRRRSSRWFRWLLVACLFWNLVAHALVGFSKESAQAASEVLVGLVVLISLARVASRIPLRAARGIAAATLVVLGMASLQYARDVFRLPLYHNDFTLHWFADWRYWEPYIAQFDDPRHPYRIAVTSGSWQNSDEWFVYPFMGRRLQNEIRYVPISGDGRIRPLAGGRFDEDLEHSANYWAWRLRLKQSHITHVISFGPASIELRWMEQHPDEFEHIGGIPRDWGIFAFRDTP